MPSKTLLRDLKFPVYKTGKVEEIRVNDLGLVIITTAKDIYVLDDTNMKDLDFPLRRMRLKAEGYNLYPLRTKINYLDNIIKYPSGTHFVDSDGYIFKYQKGKKFYQLKCFKITKRLYKDGKGTLLFCKELPYPITYNDRVPVTVPYMGVLIVDGGAILHSLVFKPFKDTRRKI